MFKKLAFLSILCSVFASPQSFGWLGSLYSVDSPNSAAPERPVILLTHEDQTTDCCDPINILPETDVKKCVKLSSNSSLTDIELHKCILNCFTSRTKIINKGKIDEKQAYNTFKFQKEHKKNPKLLKEIIKNCTTAANDLKKGLPTQAPADTCSPVSTLFVACVSGSLLKRCPAALKSNTSNCGLQFDAMKNCDVYLLPKLEGK